MTWYINKLEVTGSVSDIAAFWGYVKSSSLVAKRTIDFKKITPIPQEKQNSKDWFLFCEENWGTKFNASNFSKVETSHVSGPVDNPEALQTITFKTHNHPPVPIFKKLSDIFKNIHFTLTHFNYKDDFLRQFEFQDIFFEETIIDPNCSEGKKIKKELLEEKKTDQIHGEYIMGVDVANSQKITDKANNMVGIFIEDVVSAKKTGNYYKYLEGKSKLDDYFEKHLVTPTIPTILLQTPTSTKKDLFHLYEDPIPVAPKKVKKEGSLIDFDTWTKEMWDKLDELQSKEVEDDDEF